MRVVEAIGIIRARLYDEGGNRPPSVDGQPAWVANDRPCLWKNSELAYFILDTVHDIGVRSPLEDDRFSLSASPGKRLLRIPDPVLYLERLRWNETGDPLARSNLRIMEHVDQEYRTYKTSLADDGRRPDPGAWRATTADAPTHYLTDERRGYLTLYPIPRLAGKVTGCVRRTYDLTSDAYLWPSAFNADLPDDFVGSRQKIEALIAGTCARAYKKRDSDTNDRMRSADCEAEFNRLAGAPLSLAAIDARQRWSGDTTVIEPKTRFV